MEDNQPIKNKTTLKEKISLRIRRGWLVNKTVTILLILILFAAYVCLNLWTGTLELPEFDVTENKIYTLSDTSKNAIQKINQDITIYAYGFEEDASQIKLLKQYNEANEKIKYEILTEESNYDMIKEHDLRSGYYIMILKSNNSEKVIDASTDFYTYDYTTSQKIDTTEQTITNSILSLTEENKPKIYFTEGHGEFEFSEMQVLTTYLQNESFEINNVNLVTTGAVPEDCDILAIMSPSSDIMEPEAQAIKNYINKGGNIYYSQDVVSEGTTLPILQTVLDEFGISIPNGYTLEYEENKTASGYPNIFMPEVSNTSQITQDIYTDSYMWLVYAGKINFADDATLQNLNVEKETLLSSSDKAVFVTNLGSDLQAAMESGTPGKSEIASLLTKTINSTNENGESTSVQSKLVVSASGSFISDYVINALSENYPLSYLGSNKDFVINSMAYLGDKGNTLTIRKDMASSTYMPTESENKIVITLIFAVPFVIIGIGVIIGRYRKRRK